MTIRRRLYLTLEPTEKGGAIERIFELALVIIIILNILAILADSVATIHTRFENLFKKFELFSVLFFTAEYIARIYSIVENKKYHTAIKGRLTFMLTPLSLVDLFAFLPFYFTFLPIDLRFLRIFRLMAVFRMFKIARYLHALSMFKKVFFDRREQLILSFIFILFVLIIISFAMFYAEHDAQPAKFSSIPATLWWGVSTLTTVGYGDIVPITAVGKFLGGLFSIAGVGILALPTGILSSGFFEVMHNQKRINKCPHCGKDLVE